MLRIDAIETEGRVVLQVEGRVVGAWVGELLEACEAALAERSLLTVDLAGVEFVDRDGLALLERLRDGEVTLANCSAFVSEQLKAWSA